MRNYTRSSLKMKITRPALFSGVRSPSLDLYFYLYAFLRLLTRLGDRPDWLDSYESFSQHEHFRERKFRIRYMGYSLEFTLGETRLGLNVFSPAYERTEKGLVEILRPKYVLDVGAHLGAFTFLFARHADLVVAVEPDPRAFVALMRNLLRNGVQNVLAFPYACHSESWRTASLKLASAGRSTISDDGEVPVKTVAVDDLVRFAQMPRVDFVKIDVECGELEVLRGAEETLRTHRPTILVETSPETHGEVERLLLGLGYGRIGSLTSYKSNMKERTNHLYSKQ
jgi:FkbM family methyltransferase